MAYWWWVKTEQISNQNLFLNNDVALRTLSSTADWRFAINTLQGHINLELHELTFKTLWNCQNVISIAEIVTY